MLYVDEDEDAAFALPCMESYESVCASLSEFSEKTSLLAIGVEIAKTARSYVAKGSKPGETPGAIQLRGVAVVNSKASREERMVVVLHAVAEAGLALYLQSRCKSVPKFVEEAEKNLKNVTVQAFPVEGYIAENLLTMFQALEVTKNPRGALSRLDAPLRHTLFGTKQVIVTEVRRMQGKKQVSFPSRSAGITKDADLVTVETLKGLNQPTQTKKDSAGKSVVVATAPTFFSAAAMSVLAGIFVGRALDSSRAPEKLSQRDVYFMLKVGLLMLSGFIAEAFRDAELAAWNQAELVLEADATEPPPPQPQPQAAAAAALSPPAPVARPVGQTGQAVAPAQTTATVMPRQVVQSPSAQAPPAAAAAAAAAAAGRGSVRPTRPPPSAADVAAAEAAARAREVSLGYGSIPSVSLRQTSLPKPVVVIQSQPVEPLEEGRSRGYSGAASSSSGSRGSEAIYQGGYPASEYSSQGVEFLDQPSSQGRPSTAPRPELKAFGRFLSDDT